jgi:hypothetical protein
MNKTRRLFLDRFRPLLNQALFFEAAGAVLKIGSSLKLKSKTEPPSGNLACPNQCMSLKGKLYQTFAYEEPEF